VTRGSGDGPSDAALVRYIRNESPSAELRAIEAWISAAPSHRSRVEELSTLWLARTDAVRWQLDRMWTDVQATMEDPAPLPRLVQPSGPSAPARSKFSGSVGGRRWSAGIGSVAMVVLVVVTVGTFTVRARRATTMAPTSPSRSYATARGERATLELADGSRVTLAPESELRVSGNAGAGARDFVLEGEAIFDVVHDSLHPFRVRTGAAIVEDIGTRFDVRSYAGDAAVVVAVAEGSVTLSRAPARAGGRDAAPADRAVLQHGEEGRLAGTGRATTRRLPSLAASFGWAEGRITFADAPLPDVLRTIARWQDLDIRVLDARLASRHITAEFSAQSSADDVVSSLATAIGARVERHGRTITLGVAR